MNFDELLIKAKTTKECYVGPFVGEFGHMLIHVLPFLNYLYTEGIETAFVGHENQKVFCQDEEGNSTVADYRGLPNYFDTGVPDCNTLSRVTSQQVLDLVDLFKITAKASGKPFFDISDFHTYYHDWWQNWWFKKGYGKLFNLYKVFNPDDIKECAIGLYTRTKPGNAAGPAWDDQLLIETAAKFVDTIYVVGHPNQSCEMQHAKVKNVITKDNTEILKYLSRCKLILSPNSGSAYVAKILRIPEIVYYNGHPRGFEHTKRCSHCWSDSIMVHADTIERVAQEIKRLI